MKPCIYIYFVQRYLTVGSMGKKQYDNRFIILIHFYKNRQLKKKILKYVALQEVNYIYPVSTGDRSFYKEKKKSCRDGKLFIQPKRTQI